MAGSGSSDAPLREENLRQRAYLRDGVIERDQSQPPPRVIDYRDEKDEERRADLHAYRVSIEMYASKKIKTMTIEFEKDEPPPGARVTMPANQNDNEDDDLKSTATSVEVEDGDIPGGKSKTKRSEAARESARRRPRLADGRFRPVTGHSGPPGYALLASLAGTPPPPCSHVAGPQPPEPDVNARGRGRGRGRGGPAAWAGEADSQFGDDTVEASEEFDEALRRSAQDGRNMDCDAKRGE